MFISGVLMTSVPCLVIVSWSIPYRVDVLVGQATELGLGPPHPEVKSSERARTSPLAKWTGKIDCRRSLPLLPGAR